MGKASTSSRPHEHSNSRRGVSLAQGPGFRREERWPIAAATRAENAQPATAGARAPTPGGHARCPARGRPRGAHGRAPPLPTPLSPGLARTRAWPRPRASSAARPSPSGGEGVLTCEKKQAYPYDTGSCSRRRNRTAPSFQSSAVSLLPPQQAGEAATNVAALGFDTLASSVALANCHSGDRLRPGRLMCPFCCLH